MCDADRLRKPVELAISAGASRPSGLSLIKLIRSDSAFTLTRVSQEGGLAPAHSYQ